jgi:ABC-type protease/lipase transport system fused ATPase/permease subunit
LGIIIKIKIMESKYEEEERYLRAKKRVKDIKDFYIVLIVYLVSNLIALFVNLMWSPGFLWSLFSIFGWGIVLVFHGMKVFNFFSFLGKDWEEKKLIEFMENEKIKNKWNNY